MISEFLDIHLDALEASEARHNLLLGVLPKAGAQPREGFLTWTLGGPGQCAISISSKGPLIIGDADEDQCRELAEQTLALDYQVVVGPGHTATWFAQRAGDLGIAFAEPTPQRIHAISEWPIIPPAPGQSRLAVVEDTDIFVAWVMEFASEATPRDPPPQRSGLGRMLSEGRVLFWVVDAEPVSMGSIMRRTRHAAAISWVYTPPRLRNRGYAGATTAALVERIYAEGRTTACLYTDLRNPISNRCYAKIGFRPVCDAFSYSKLR